MRLTRILVLSVTLVGIFQTGESMGDLQENCCEEKVVDGVTYKGHTVISDDDIRKQWCLRNFGYRRQGFLNIPSNNYAKFRKEAEETYQQLDHFIMDKTKEYQNLPRSTLKAKLMFIKKDIEETTGLVWNTTSVSDFINRELDKIKNHPTIEKLTKGLIQDFNSITSKFYHKFSISLLEDINQKDAKLLCLEQNNEYAEQASHQGIQAEKFVLDFINSSFGSDPSNLDKLVTAILYNTEHSRDSFHPIGRYRGAASCGVHIGGGAVGGAVGGCVAGAVVGAGIGCGPGAVAGAITGTFIGVAKCIGEIIADVIGCFAPSSQVETISGMKEISELQLGDLIRTSSGGSTSYFTEFIGWLDRQKSSPVRMLQFSFSGAASTLTLTAGHVLFTNTSTKYADTVRPGDRLISWNGSEMEEQEVTEILPTIQDGFWAPLTRDGTLLVDNILSSCYASFPHQLADLAMTPVKAFPRYLLDDEQSQHNDGVRSVVKAIKRVGEWVGARKENGEKNELQNSLNLDKRPFVAYEKSEF